MEVLSEGIVGSVGGVVARSVAYPFDTLKVQLATGSIGLGDLVKRIIREEGVLGFYRGLLPFSAFEAAYQKGLFVLVFTAVKRLYAQRSRRDPPVLATVCFGYLSDLVSVPFTVPFEALVVRLQSASVHDSKMDVIRESLCTRAGIRQALVSGNSYVVLSLKPGIEFAIFDHLKYNILTSSGRSDLSSGTALLLGGFARAIATICVYPYARCKALTQSQQAPGALAALQKVLSDEGGLALYRGLSMEICRGATQSAVMFAVIERLRSAVEALVLGQANGRSGVV